jgi:hypothetical protein
MVLYKFVPNSGFFRKRSKTCICNALQRVGNIAEFPLGRSRPAQRVFSNLSWFWNETTLCINRLLSAGYREWIIVLFARRGFLMDDDTPSWLGGAQNDQSAPALTPDTPSEFAAAFNPEVTAETLATAPQANEGVNGEYLWLARLLRRLGQGKETRKVDWGADLEQHLLSALASPEIAGKPPNMPPGIWYWVTEASQNGEDGWYILLMVVSTNRPKPAGLAIMATEITDRIKNAGYRCTVNRQRLSRETLKRLPFNTRRLLGSSKRYRGKAFHVLRYHLKPAASS